RKFRRARAKPRDPTQRRFGNSRLPGRDRHGRRRCISHQNAGWRRLWRANVTKSPSQKAVRPELVEGILKPIELGSKPEFDPCVIGGGSAGLVVAAGGAGLGAKVELVEKRSLGGDCLYSGCVPSKALLHSAKVANTLRSAGRAAIGGCEPDIDLTKVMER